MSERSYDFSRRTALAAAGAVGSAMVLSACAPKVRGIASEQQSAGATASSSSSSSPSSSSSSSSSSSRNYAGEVRFTSFDTSAGAYEPATKDHPSKNVPKPTKPSDISDKSAAGFYAAIGYTTAAMQYAMETLDFSLVADAFPPEYKDVLESKFNQLKQQTTNSKSWFGGPKFKAILKSPEPTMNGTSATWEGTISFSLGTFYGPSGVSRESETETSDTLYRGTYTEGRWWAIYGSSSGSSGSGSSQEFSL